VLDIFSSRVRQNHISIKHREVRAGDAIPGLHAPAVQTKNHIFFEQIVFNTRYQTGSKKVFDIMLYNESTWGSSHIQLQAYI
jgi:hypothetical protein